MAGARMAMNNPLTRSQEPPRMGLRRPMPMLGLALLRELQTRFECFEATSNPPSHRRLYPHRIAVSEQQPAQATAKPS